MGCGLDHGLPGLAVSDDGRPVRVLGCDDHEVLRHGLRTVLCRVPDLAVVAEAADADEARSLAGTVRPDVALVGLGAQGPVVRDLAREMTGRRIRVVLLGEAGAGSDLVEALRAGARLRAHDREPAAPARGGPRGGVWGDGPRLLRHGELLHRLDRPAGGRGRARRRGADQRGDRRPPAGQPGPP
jgi:CheY-like chemotaxis protein